jgi:hypothetical protein
MISPIIQRVYTLPEVTSLDVTELSPLAQAVIWSRGGEERVVTRGTLAATRDLYQDACALVTVGRIVEAPKEWKLIGWDACIPIAASPHVVVNSP